MRRLSVAVIGLTWFMSLNTPGWGDTRTVSVAGEGSVSAPPDIATAQTGVGKPTEGRTVDLGTNQGTGTENKGPTSQHPETPLLFLFPLKV